MLSIDSVGVAEQPANVAEQMTALQALRQAVGRVCSSSPGFGDASEDRLRNSAAIELACVWEATAPKVGNVHPGAAFGDCCYQDFCDAAKRVAPILAGADRIGDAIGPVGDRVLRAIHATGEVTPANVNLGIVLLIAPLATARDRGDIPRVLAAIDADQGAKVYQAIQLACPGGVKREEVAAKWDVTSRRAGPNAAPSAAIDLVSAMRMARDRDRIALQYADDFLDFFENIVPLMASELAMKHPPGEAILRGQLRMLAQRPDTLIARKCGAEIADEAMRRAGECVDASGNFSAAAIEDYDRWLRAQGNRRNPGTTADLIAAAIYWLIR